MRERPSACPCPGCPVNESSSDTSVQKGREGLALKAIYSVATLSTHYQPLILGLRPAGGSSR